MEDGYTWDLDEYFSILDYLTLDSEEKYGWMIVREGKNIKQMGSEGRFENAPDTPKGKTGKLTVARKVDPAVMLLKQDGSESNGWRATPFGGR